MASKLGIAMPTCPHPATKGRSRGPLPPWVAVMNATIHVATNPAAEPSLLPAGRRGVSRTPPVHAERVFEADYVGRTGAFRGGRSRTCTRPVISSTRRAAEPSLPQRRKVPVMTATYALLPPPEPPPRVAPFGALYARLRPLGLLRGVFLRLRFQLPHGPLQRREQKPPVLTVGLPLRRELFP